ncbi:hypothetical protein PLICRDRAFT_93548 [Plicaturopsis crispa FD-325 SS-3]|nr:hypothetical protein PLICRDRAFT_93548 [Plicaturopsis crispa FD-325 SS-3]
MSSPARNAPLAGRPPFATDIPDSAYGAPQAPQPRIRQKPAPDPNARTSAYNVYDNYIQDAQRESGSDALGQGFMNMADDDDDDHAKPAASPIAAPRPGYAAPIAALNLSRPNPAATQQPQMSQVPSALRVAGNPRAPPPAMSPGYNGARSPPGAPRTPHPLEAPLTPITPVFARPSKSPAPRENVKFSNTAIMRGGSEDDLLPKRGEKGDDFWRRFSMVVKEEQQKPYQSSWLKKTQNGTTRLSRWVWVVGMLLFVCIAGAIALGAYAAHKSTAHNAPKAFGGSANEVASSSAAASTAGSSSIQHVSPTNTVQRRFAEPSGIPLPVANFPVPIVHNSRRVSRHANRTHTH